MFQEIQIHVHVGTFESIHVHVGTLESIHDVIGDVEREKERKKERHLRQWKNEKESCLRWDSNPRHSVLQTCTCRYT